MTVIKVLIICISCLIFQVVEGISVCEKKEVTEKQGIITSPNFPNDYPTSTDCTLRIQGGEGQTIKVEFGEVDIEDNSDDKTKCVDLLTLQDAKKVKRVCGKGIPTPFTSDGNYVDVIFKSDDSVEKKGFILNYTITSVANICPSRSLPAGDGTIISPNFPNNYDSNTRCTLTLPIPKGFRYDVKFITFNVQYDQACKYDRLDIKTESTGRRLCGEGLPNPYSFRGQKMTLDFKTDSLENGKGFKLEYRLVEDTLPLEQCMCTEGNEYVHLELAQSFLERDTDDISFSFKSEKKNGLLIYAKGTYRDYIFVAIKRGVLDIQMDLGTGVGRKKLGTNFADGRWHNFRLSRQGKNITVDVDNGNHKVNFRTPWIFTRMDLPQGNFYFGGSNLNKVPFHLRTANFYGCLKDVKVDKIQPLRSAVQGEEFFRLVGKRRVKKCPYSD